MSYSHSYSGSLLPWKAFGLSLISRSFLAGDGYSLLFLDDGTRFLPCVPAFHSRIIFGAHILSLFWPTVAFIVSSSTLFNIANDGWCCCCVVHEVRTLSLWSTSSEVGSLLELLFSFLCLLSLCVLFGTVRNGRSSCWNFCWCAVRVFDTDVLACLYHADSICWNGPSIYCLLLAAPCFISCLGLQMWIVRVSCLG